MNAPLTLSDAFADMDVANRCPTAAEYKAASPCMRRAIYRRWLALSKGKHDPKQGYFCSCPACSMKRLHEQREHYEKQEAARREFQNYVDEPPGGDWNDEHPGGMRSWEWGR